MPVVKFKKGENKEEKARPYIEAAAREGKDHVVLIGIAQEKASAWRSWPAKGHENRSHPHMEYYYKSSRLKQYFKEGKALRTETVICDTKDFGIGRRVCSENWKALKEVG